MHDMLAVLHQFNFCYLQRLIIISCVEGLGKSEKHKYLGKIITPGNNMYREIDD